MNQKPEKQLNILCKLCVTYSSITKTLSTKKTRLHLAMFELLFRKNDVI